MAKGKKVWAFAAGHIPLVSTGSEPEFTSCDKIAVLNTGRKETGITITVYYDDRDPVIYREVRVPARSVRKIRLNDLIDPVPIPLDKPYAIVVRSPTKVVVQFSRVDTGAAARTGFCVTGYCADL